jgi:hypothetical protein
MNCAPRAFERQRLDPTHAVQFGDPHGHRLRIRRAAGEREQVPVLRPRDDGNHLIKDALGLISRAGD